MKYQITIISLFLVFGLIQKVNSQTESSWLENYEITQLASPEKDILVLSIKNSGKSKKDCLRKAKEQALFHILFKGILRNEISLGSNVLPRKPIPFLEKFDQTDEKNGLYRFICKTGLGNIVDAEKDENIDVVKNEDKSKTFVSVIKLNARSTVTQLEELDLKRTFIEELGFKPKILFIPGDLDQIESYLSNTETNPLVAEYNNQYNLINASFGKSFDLINIFSLREKLETELSINHEKSAEFKEREIDIISRVYVSNVILLLKHLRDKQTGFQATVDPILLSFISVGNSTLNSIGGASKKTDLELIQTILSSETESIIEDIFFNLIDQKGKTNVVKVEISCNSRLKKRIDEKIIYAENNLTFFEIIQDFISSRGLKLTSNGKSNNQCTISFENFMSPFLAQQEKFVEELTTLVEQKTGLALDIDWIGNSLVRFELTDMKRLERQRKINSDYQRAISQKSLELHLQFLKEFPDVEYFSEMKDRYNALITDKVKNKLKDEEYKALLNEEFCTTSRNDVIVSYIQAQIPDNWESIISLDELKNVIQKVKQVSKENNREFSNSENYRNLTNRYNTIISEKIKIKLSNEEFEALLKDEFCTTSRNDVIVSYIQAQIPENWAVLTAMDELKKVIQSINQISQDYTFDYTNTSKYQSIKNRYNELIIDKIKTKLSREEYAALLKDEYCSSSRKSVEISFIESLIPMNWKEINTLKGINDLVKNINSACKENNLSTSLMTNYSYSTSDFSNSGEWTFENLNVSHFNNGDSIYEARTNEEWIRSNNEKRPAWCYYNNEEGYNGEGKLYNYYALSDPRGLVRDGYVIPSLEDYQNLINLLGGKFLAGRKMKAVVLWGEELRENEEFMGGFAAKVTGYRNEHGIFMGGFPSNAENGETSYTGFWTSTQNGSNATVVYLQQNSDETKVLTNSDKGNGWSVRFMKKKSENDPYFVSLPLIAEIQLKRDQFILNEFQSKKDEESILNFFCNQLKEETNNPSLKTNEVDYLNFYELYHRIWDNLKLVKNGFYPYYRAYKPYPDISGIMGEGGQPYELIKVGYTNNIENYQEFDDGTIYKGSMANGIFNGEGILISGEYYLYGLPQGAKYQGTFKDGEFIKGKIIYPNGNIYEGECQYYQPNGQGKLTLTNGQVQQGKFENGEFIKPFQCKTAKIGNQVWMAENLKVIKFRNGDPIPEANSKQQWAYAARNAQPAWCYVEGDPTTSNKFGILYNWYAVNDSRGLAPEGWHIPSDYEWNEIADFLGGNEIAGIKMKSKEGWEGGFNGSNSSGFNGLPGGFCAGEYYRTTGAGGYWWSSTELDNTNAFYYSLWWGRQLDIQYYTEYFPDDHLYRDTEIKSLGFSVRCVKD
jgi:uncharacterized protein (TIGR02145 family)